MVEKLLRILYVTPILGSTTWFLFLGGAVHPIVPFSQDNEESSSMPLLESGRHEINLTMGTLHFI